MHISAQWVFCYQIRSVLSENLKYSNIFVLSNANDNEWNLDILSFFIRDHHFNNQMFNMGRKGFLADMFDQSAEFHR